MKSGQYGSAFIEDCLRCGHKFQTAWSDKNPMKVSLICKTCTANNHGKTVYVAYGIDTQGFGVWPSRRRHKDIQQESHETPDESST